MVALLARAPRAAQIAADDHVLVDESTDPDVGELSQLERASNGSPVGQAHRQAEGASFNRTGRHHRGFPSGGARAQRRWHLPPVPMRRPSPSPR